MKHYIRLPQTPLARGQFAIQSVQPDHIELIRQWRNAQLDVLRQVTAISAEEQQRYYAAHIWPDMEQPLPANILVSYLHQDRLIGYGGLVHIAWEHLRAEVSFLLDPARSADRVQYGRDFSTFLALIQELAFARLGLRRLFTETYAGRDYHIAVLERAGFRLEGVLREHILRANKPENCIIHGCLKSDAG